MGALDPLYMSLADAERDQITSPASHGLSPDQAPVGIPFPWNLARIICRKKTSSLFFQTSK